MRNNLVLSIILEDFLLFFELKRPNSISSVSLHDMYVIKSLSAYSTRTVLYQRNRFFAKTLFCIITSHPNMEG